MVNGERRFPDRYSLSFHFLIPVSCFLNLLEQTVAHMPHADEDSSPEIKALAVDTEAAHAQAGKRAG